MLISFKGFFTEGPHFPVRSEQGGIWGRMPPLRHSTGPGGDGGVLIWLIRSKYRAPERAVSGAPACAARGVREILN